MIRPESYQILITPLHKRGVYDTPLELDFDQSDYINDSGVGVIRQEVDNGDFDFGTFTFGNIKIKGINVDGKFSSINDNPKTIFRWDRDLAKVQINYFDGETNTPSVRFNGFVNEEGTLQDFMTQEISFDVLARSSIFRKIKVTGGQISNNILFSNAINRLLNIPEITSILNYDPLNINLRYDDFLQDGSQFDDLPVIEALNLLLLASNSILVVDTNDVIHVRSRSENPVAHFFYGPGDYLGRENILSLKRFNDGLQRSFNSIVVNDAAVLDPGWIFEAKLRQKVIELPFITNPDIATNVATQLLYSFKHPKLETEIVVKTKDALAVNILDSVGIYYPKRVKPLRGKKMAIYGQRLYNDPDVPYPFTHDDMAIPDVVKFKVIGKVENLKDFTTTLKLRQAGERNATSGYFGYDTSYQLMNDDNYETMGGQIYQLMSAVS